MPVISLPKIIHAATKQQMYDLVSDTNEQLLDVSSSEEKIEIFEPFYSVELDSFISLATSKKAKRDHENLYTYMRVRNHVIEKLETSTENICFHNLNDPSAKEFQIISGEVSLDVDSDLKELRFISLVIPQKATRNLPDLGPLPVSILVHDTKTDNGLIVGFRSLKAFGVMNATTITEVSSRKEEWLCQKLFNRTCDEFRNLKSDRGREIWAAMDKLIQEGLENANQDLDNTPPKQPAM